MPRTYTICQLPAERLQKANQALLAGESYRSVARRFETSAAALLRHKSAHLDGLRRKAVKVQEARELSRNFLLASPRVESSGKQLDTGQTGQDSPPRKGRLANQRNTRSPGERGLADTHER